MPRKRAKRRSPWGSITEVEPGRKYVLRWVENTPQGRVRRSHTLRGTYAEASLWLDRKHVECADAGDRPVPTFGKAYAMWFEPWLSRRVADGKAKERTRSCYEGAWRLHVEPRWGSVPIDSLRPEDAQEWLLGLPAGIAQHALTVMRRILDFAVRYEVVPTNKMRIPYEMPTAKVRGRSRDVLALADADSMFRRLRGAVCEAPFILACFGSARTGEALGVRADEIGRAESHGLVLATVPIVRRMDAGGSLPLPDGDLKTPQSERTLVIPEPYGTRLLEIAEQRRADGVEWLADRCDGLPMAKAALRRTWMREAGADAIPFANLRNSWRTFAKFEWRVDDDTLELLMGHVIPTVTGRHYLRPNVPDLVESVARAVSASRAEKGAVR